ncbi:MAG: preprotein translocase subunit YajC [Planctomycetes bacterium]|nr:preprotein translocase subunit YajC [Planctomycetota bacterium]
MMNPSFDSGLPQEPSRVPTSISAPGGDVPAPATTAETAVPAQGGSPGGAKQEANWTGMLLPIALVFGFMWLFVLRPERKRQKERAAMISAIGKGDRVVTLGGMHGEVVRLDEKTITLKVDEGVRLKFDRSAVSRIPSAETGAAAPAAS